MEGLNDVVDDVYILPQQSELEEGPKRCRLDNRSHVVDPNHQQVAEEESPRIKEDNEDQLVEPLGSSRVTGSTWILILWTSR
jgi:hypothetical protein